jgi:hypothetical protein
MSGGTSVLVYGVRVGKEREPQSLRALNADTFEKILRGVLGVVGGRMLAPLPAPRKSIDVSVYNDPECPVYHEYCKAVSTLLDEGIKIPNHLMPVEMMSEVKSSDSDSDSSDSEEEEDFE